VTVKDTTTVESQRGTAWWLTSQRRGPSKVRRLTSLQKKYGRSVAERQKVIAGCGLEKHMEIVGYLKSEYGMGHGHANALVGWTLAGNTAAPDSQSE
jgi:hypothetical protein